jgi:hypothetical protein
MMRNYQERIQQSALETWLNETIYCEGVNYARRSQVILTFIRDLRGFISSKGYAFRMDEVTMAKGWARFLFLNQNRSIFKGHFQKNPLARPEDTTMFHDIFDSISREPFENMLIEIQDFDPSTSKGCHALAAVFPFAWYYIDINNSSPTEIVDDMLETSDSEEDDKPKTRLQTDPYLVDQANAASKYNRWD